nr:glycosyltransferase family 4 protein [bacterium]
MRVLVSIFEELYPLSGGGSPRISNLCRAFARGGHEVIAAGGFAASDREVREYLGCRELVRLKSVSRLDPGKMKKYLTAHPVNLARVGRAVRRLAPDLVVSHNTIAGYGALLGAGISRRRPFLVLDLTDVLFEYLDDYRSGGWLRAVQRGGRRLETSAIRGSDLIITISDSMKEIVEGYGASPRRIEVVCDGVDPDIFRETDETALRARHAPGAEAVI